MRATIIILLLSLGYVFSSAILQNDESDKIVSVGEFESFVDTLGMKFVLPENFEPSIVKSNRDLWYGFAMQHKKEDFEVRYSVWSLAPEMARYELCKEDTNCVMIDPNKIYSGRIQSNVLNMTGGDMWEIGPFPDDAVKKEFNADKGGSSFFEFNCGFGEGYKYGQMMYLHKDGVADVIITFMSNSKDNHSDLMFEAFYALTFK